MRLPPKQTHVALISLSSVHDIYSHDPITKNGEIKR